MITIESTSNKDLIFSCEKTPANEVIVIVVVMYLCGFLLVLWFRRAHACV